MQTEASLESAPQLLAQLSEDARKLFKQLNELFQSMQRTSEANVISTYQHLLLYREAVTGLQVLSDNLGIADLCCEV